MTTTESPIFYFPFAAWLAARGTFTAGWIPVWIPAAADFAFGSGLLVAIAVPIRDAGRRIMPSFIAVGTGTKTPLRNRAWVDRSALVLYGILVVAMVFVPVGVLVAVSAALLALVHGIRAAGWYAPGIWKRPLLWTLYVSYLFTIAGFGLLALSHWGALPPLVGIHALGAGGIGLITAGMMARVSLGHTGRGIANLPRGTAAAFSLLLAAAIVRVAFPIAVPGLQWEWVIASQSLRMLGFALLAARFLPVWTGPSA